MGNRKKGRRIYTFRARNHRVFSRYHPLRSALGMGITLVLAAVLAFVGYHVLGPIFTRMRAEKENPTKTPEPFFAEETDSGAVAEQTQPVTDVTTTVLLTTMTTTTVTEVTTTETVATLPSSAAKEPVNRFGEDVTVAYLSKAEVLKDLDSVEAEASRLAAAGYQEMVLPMKETGGMLHYYSSNEKAAGCGATNPEMLTPREIRNAAGRYHMNCAAILSTLEDRVYPNTYMDGSYTFKEGAVRWLDNKPENDGKPWLSPFTDAAKGYLVSLADELNNAGFSRILCTDTKFPNFFESDTELLGDRIQDPERRSQALLSVLNAIAAKAPDACCMIDLHKAVSGEEEAFVPDKLKMKTVCVQIDLRDFTEPFKAGGERYDPTVLSFEDKAAMLVRAAKKAAGGKKLYPCIVRNGLSEAELESVISIWKENGYDRILVTEK